MEIEHYVLDRLFYGRVCFELFEGGSYRFETLFFVQTVIIKIYKVVRRVLLTPMVRVKAIDATFELCRQQRNDADRMYMLVLTNAVFGRRPAIRWVRFILGVRQCTVSIPTATALSSFGSSRHS